MKSLLQPKLKEAINISTKSNEALRMAIIEQANKETGASAKIAAATRIFESRMKIIEAQALVIETSERRITKIKLANNKLMKKYVDKGDGIISAANGQVARRMAVQSRVGLDQRDRAEAGRQHADQPETHGCKQV